MGIDRDMDGVLDRDTGSPPPPPPPSPALVMHVAEILTTDATGAPKRAFRRGETVFWRVRIVDQPNAPVGGASVTTVTSRGGTTIATSTSTTAGDGWALFSRSTRNNPRTTYRITVTRVAKTAATYDPAANATTSTTFTLQ